VPRRREIAYVDPLADHGEYLRVRISTAAGNVVAFTVQYETVIGAQRMPVVRYDSQHGAPHRDILNRAGALVDKRWIHRPLKEALQFAIGDIRKNWERYKVLFEEAQE